MTAFSTTRQYKLDKSQDYGYLTGGLSLAPSNGAALAGYSDIPTTCAMAGACGPVCLQFAGMNNMTTHKDVRIQRTVALFRNREATLAQLDREIQNGAKRAAAKGWGYAFRPNLLSDLPWLGMMLAKRNPNVQFYDYTKIPKPWQRVQPNYHLTFSYSERSTWDDVRECFDHGINVAVVFAVRKGEPLPTIYRGTKELRLRDIPIINGDLHDLRFKDPVGHLVALGFKGGRAKMDAAVKGCFALPAPD